MHYIKLNPYTNILSQPLDRKKVEIELVFTSGGSWFEDQQDRGKKHLLEHCIASRTKELDFQGLKDYEFKENISLNAYTGPVTMGLSASGHCSDFRKMIDILLEMAFEPTFDQSILDKEKEIVLREISERRGEPNYKLHFDTMNQVFTEDSYSVHEVLGDSKMVEQTTLGDFVNLHAQNLRDSHIIINLSGGNIETDYTETKIREYIGRNQILHENNKLPINFVVDNKFKEFSLLPIVHELAHEHADLSVFLKCPVNFANKPALQIFECLFLRYGGVLYDRLRDELGLVYGLQSSFDFNLQLLDIYLSCEIKYISVILNEIEKVFSDFSAHFKPQKFQDFKKIIAKKQEISQDTLGAGTAFIQNSLRIYGIPETSEEYTSRLNNVTEDDIKLVYSNIQSQLVNKKALVVSKDKAIGNLKF